MNEMKNQKGFTLIELIIVIAFIIAIILAVCALFVGGHFINKFW